MNIVCVLRQSPDFGPAQVHWLKRQCDEFIPHTRFVCYSDTDVAGVDTIPLRTDWPKWWAKMEAYGDPDLRGPCLVLDLDVVVRRGFNPTDPQLEKNWIARHPVHDGFKAPEGFNCALMMVTEEFRRKVYAHFSSDPMYYMTSVRWDDQIYFKKFWDRDLSRFQDEWPDEVTSYKLGVLQHGLRDDNTFILFHGQPRPWDVKESWIPPC